MAALSLRMTTEIFNIRCLSCIRFKSHRSTDYSNFPDTYIKKQKENIEWKNPKGMQYNPGKVIKNRVYNYTVNRPWEREAKADNPPHSNKWLPDYVVDPIKSQDWCYFRGDKVEVLVGKDRGKHGIVNYLIPERNWIIVEGLNCEYKYIGGNADYPGMMVKSEKPLTIREEVSLIDPSDKKPTAIEWRFTEQGERVRVSARTGRIIPIPHLNNETYDYKTKSTYDEKAKDTKAEDLEQITFTPSIKTFEMDIMDEMGLKDDKIPQKTYWY